jgi:hypothetical protein
VPAFHARASTNAGLDPRVGDAPARRQTRDSLRRPETAGEPARSGHPIVAIALDEALVGQPRLVSGADGSIGIEKEPAARAAAY